jgi:lipopolysaccharide transport system ATP-binding protein
MQPTIQVENVSKQYRLGKGGSDDYHTLREALADSARWVWNHVRGKRNGLGGPPTGSGVNSFWALKDVSFEVRPGEVVGIIGRNGAGKSTLLKILSRIVEPTSGRAVVRGRMGSLLEVGTGFHPELTGRENIFLNGAILGMTRREIIRKFDEIVAFSEIEQFLDTPVKRYSSGMYVRLAFAVAAHLEPEILLVDEVLAVGDLAFQRKCLGKMGEVSREGRTVFFVSHNMPAVEALCDRGVWLKGGRLVMDAPARECVQAYVAQTIDEAKGSCRASLLEHPNRRSGCQPLLRGMRLLDGEGRECNTVLMGGELQVEILFAAAAPLHGLNFGVGVDDSHGKRLVTFTTTVQPADQVPCAADSGVVSIRVVDLPLTPGHYFLSPTVSGGSVSDIVDQALAFDVLPRDIFGNGKVPNPNQGCFYHAATFLHRPAGPSDQTLFAAAAAAAVAN